MSFTENPGLEELGDMYLEYGENKAVKEAESLVREVLGNELSFMDLETPEVVVEDPEEEAEYHATYRPIEDELTFSPRKGGDDPDAREVAIHELFHKQQDIEFLGLSKAEKSYSEAVSDLGENIAWNRSGGGFRNRVRRKLGMSPSDVRQDQEIFIEDALGKEGSLPALFTVYASRYPEEFQEFSEEASGRYSDWRSVQEERSDYSNLLGMAGKPFEITEVFSQESREVVKIEDSIEQIKSSTSEQEIKEEIEEIDSILEENGKEYRAPEINDNYLSQVVDPGRMAYYNEVTQQALEGFRNDLVERINEKEDIENPVPKYFQEAFAHAASMVANCLIGDRTGEQEYWKNKVERPYNRSFSYERNAGSMARELGEEVVDSLRDLEQEKDMYRRIAEIQAEKVEEYRMEV
jgi:hypothetical protein